MLFEGFIAYNLLELLAKAGTKSTKKMAYSGDCFRNMHPRQGDTRLVRHLFCILKARGVRNNDDE